MELLPREWKVMVVADDRVEIEGTCDYCFWVLHLLIGRQFIFEGDTALTYKCDNCGTMNTISRISGSLHKPIRNV